METRPMKPYLKKLEDQIHHNGSHPALCDYGGASFTYADLAKQIELYHIYFRTIGIRKGDKIALCARNSARWAISFLAVNTYGAVIVPLLADFTPDSAAHLVDHSESVLLFVDPDMWKRMDVSLMPRLRAAINCKADKLLWTAGKKYETAWSHRKKQFSGLYPDGLHPEKVSYNAFTEEDLAIINYTSGTSGEPKGVMLPYRAMSDIVEYCQGHICPEPDRLVSILPLAHMYGLAIEFVYPCCTGFTIHFLGKAPSPSLLLKALQEVQPGLMVTVPLVMEKIYHTLVVPQLAAQHLKMPGFNSFYYKSVGKKLLKQLGGRVQTIIIGGAPLNWDVECGFRQIGLPYVVGYGMTEACPLLAYEQVGKYVPGSCGKPIHTIRIDSSDPENVPGEIQAQGPNLTIGYFKNPEADANAWTEDGWLRTGDLGTLDSGGNLFIRGRIKALILSATGQNIYPEEIEQLLDMHPYVKESVVVDRGGKVVALVYPDTDAIASLEERDHTEVPEIIRAQINAKLPAYSQIGRLELVDMPLVRTAKGTVKRHLYQ
jgi:long-chain acyl-CoA synthetase